MPDEISELNYHDSFIRIVRKHFDFLELPSEGQSAWMEMFFQSIQMGGRPAVLCGYFDVFFRIDFNWEPDDQWLGVHLYKLPKEYGFIDSATARIERKHYVVLNWAVALANPDYNPQFGFKAVWLPDVDKYLESLATAMKPVVSKLLGPHWNDDQPPRSDFPFFEEVAALDLEAVKARLAPAQLEGDS